MDRAKTCFGLHVGAAQPSETRAVHSVIYKNTNVAHYCLTAVKGWVLILLHQWKSIKKRKKKKKRYLEGKYNTDQAGKHGMAPQQNAYSVLDRLYEHQVQFRSIQTHTLLVLCKRFAGSKVEQTHTEVTAYNQITLKV